MIALVRGNREGNFEAFKPDSWREVDPNAFEELPEGLANGALIVEGN